MGTGIDYGLGKTNVDVANGIRYGVISQHSVGQAWYDDSQPYYGEPSCPICGNPTFTAKDRHDNEFAVCEPCARIFEDDELGLDMMEPISWYYEDDEYSMETCLDSDIMIVKSPYFTMARYCSPCVPGAGNLDDHDPDGVMTYCLGHDWFEDNKAPYPVFKVSDHSKVDYI